MNSLVDIKKLRDVKNKFIEESGFFNINNDVKFKIENRQENYSEISYEQGDKKYIKVPNELIPFWAKEGEILYYEGGEFHRDL